MTFLSGVATAAVALIAAIVFGVSRFPKPVGKLVAISAGVLLVAPLAVMNQRVLLGTGHVAVSVRLCMTRTEL